MRRLEVLREAFLNITTGTARTVPLALILAVVTGLGVGADAHAMRAIDQQARTFQSSGASVLTFTSTGAIDPVLCDRLASQPGVRAAGALRRAPDTTFVTASQTSVPVYDVTPGIITLLHTHPTTATTAGVVLSDQAATTIGARPGDTIGLGTAHSHVAGVYAYPDDGRQRGYGYAVLNPVAARGLFDSCWVDQWPQTPSMRRLLQGTTSPDRPDTTAQTSTSQLNPTLGSSLDAHALTTQRLTRWAPVLTFLTGLLLALLAIRLRRLELAANLHAGLRRRHLLAINLLETLAWTLPAVSIGIATAALFAVTGLQADAPSTLANAALTWLAAALGAFVGTLWGNLLIREDRLFSYFKQR